MKRIAWFIAVILLAPVMASAADPVLRGREVRITTSLGDQYDPAISGNLVVYADRRTYDDADVCYTDLATQQEVLVTSAPGDQELTDVSDGRIAFMDSGTNDVKVYSVLDGSTVNLTSDVRAVAREPGIGKDLVAWEDSRDGNWEIYARDLASSEMRRVSASPDSDMRPSVHAGVIVWQRCSPTTCAIFAYDWASSVTTQITDFLADSQRPDVYDGTVVFECNLGGTDYDVFRYDLGTGALQRLALPGNQINANVSGDFVAYEGLAEDQRYHVMLWHLPTGAVFVMQTGTSGSQFLNDIDGNRVVYTDDRDGQFDIYLYEFSLVPTAAAGADQSVHVGTPVTLDGSASVDPDKNYPLTYAWKIVSAPQGSTAALLNPTSVSPSLTPDASGDYVVELVVTDAMQTLSDPGKVTVSTWNTPPVADAGPDQSVQLLNAQVTLDGNGSYDDDGDPITFAWTLTEKPQASMAELYGASTASPQFVADVHGDYVCTLVASDIFGVPSAADSVTVSFTNVRPVADAGGNQAVLVTTLVTLDGSGGTDANGDPLTYRWSLVSIPPGSAVRLSLTSSPAVAAFTPDSAGQYVASLVVNDGFADSDPANVTITATSSIEEVAGTFPPLLNKINSLPLDAFKNGNMRNALTNKLAAVLADIESGRYADALSKLENDVLAKTDGCALTGAPDKNDWIKDCTAQEGIYPALLEIMALLRDLI